MPRKKYQKKQLKMPLQDYLKSYGIELEPEEKQVIINGNELNYIVRKDGTIISYQKNCKNPQILQQFLLETPYNNKSLDNYDPNKLYRAVNLVINGKQKTFHVHRIVAESFIINDDPEHKTQVNHINGNKSDNSVNNLEWITPKDNIHEAYRLGLKHGKKGSKHPMAFINEDIAYEICVLLIYTNLAITDIAQYTKSTVPIVSKINKGNRWKHVSSQFNLTYTLMSHRKDNLKCSTTREKDVMMKYHNIT